MESINDGRNNKYAVRVLFLLRKYEWEIPHKLLQCLRKCCGRLKHRWSLDKRNDGFQNRRNRVPILPRSGRPVTAVSPEMLQRAGTIIGEEGRITNRQLARCLLIRKGGVYHIIWDLGYWNVCSKWVPRCLKFEQEPEWKTISSDLFTAFVLGTDLLTLDY